MENLTVWKTIKIGFWLGIGFIIPTIFMMIGGSTLMVFATPMMIESSMEEYNMDYMDDYDVTEHISVVDYTDKSSDGRLLIVGQLQNNGEETAESINLEAELLDADGKFVYECTEYVNASVASGATENFQIKCGCSKNSIPEYDSLTIRVVSARTY